MIGWCMDIVLSLASVEKIVVYSLPVGNECIHIHHGSEEVFHCEYLLSLSYHTTLPFPYIHPSYKLMLMPT